MKLMTCLENKPVFGSLGLNAKWSFRASSIKGPEGLPGRSEDREGRQEPHGLG